MSFFSRLSLLALVAAFSSAGTACYISKRNCNSKDKEEDFSSTKKSGITRVS